jgi:hypothetical protein
VAGWKGNDMRTKSLMAKTTNPSTGAGRLRTACAARLLPLLLLALPAAVHAEDFIYTTNDGAITITGYNGPGGAVTIPDTINDLPVTGIGNAAFAHCTSLTSVTIPNSVTSIGDWAFEFCTSLTSVAIPNGVTAIGSDAFFDCASLTSVTIPNSVTNIGAGAFLACTSLAAITVDALNPVYSSVDGVLLNKSQTTLVACPGGKAGTNTIPNNVTRIADYAFCYCTSLTRVTIPDSVTDIGNHAFDSCTRLTGVYFKGNAPSLGSSVFYGDDNATVYCPPGTMGWGATFGGRPTVFWNPPAPYTYTTNNGTITLTKYTGSGGAVTIPSAIDGVPVTSVGHMAFYYCTSLTSVTISNSVTSIGTGAFSFCPSLTNITIGNSVTSIGDSAFQNCTSLMAINVEPPNAAYSSVDGVLFNKSQTTLIQCPGGKPGTYTIPNTVSSIGSWAFSYCTSLTCVTIPDSVTSIGSSAFCSCISLSNITIPDSVTSIGSSAFSSCTSLGDLTIGNSVTNLGSFAFQSCISLTSVTILNSVTSIGDYAFSWCPSLTSVTIPNRVTNIGDGAFSYCTSLTEVYFQGNAPSVDSSLFLGDTKATVYYLSGTMGWGATFGGRPTMLWKPQVQTSDASIGVRTNQFGFTITWASGMVIVVEACTNLASPIWSPLQTNTFTSDSSYFSDPEWTNYPGRFYRLRSL